MFSLSDYQTFYDSRVRRIRLKPEPSLWSNVAKVSTYSHKLYLALNKKLTSTFKHFISALSSLISIKLNIANLLL